MRQTGPPRVFPTVVSLGAVQVVSWGTLYYSSAVLAKPVSAGLGLDEVELFTAFSLGLLVSGLLAPFTGRWIDRFGGRRVMTAGSLLAVIGFVLLATATSRLQCYAGWLIAGLAMSGTLYDAVFASLRWLFTDVRYRHAVTVVTVFGGLASTAFWPLSDVLNGLVGWRWTYSIFAALHLGGAVVHGLSADRVAARRRSGAIEPALSRGLFHDARYRLLAVSFACAAFTFSAVSTFAVRTLGASGLDHAAVLGIVSIIGPMQVAGRLLEYLSARHLGIERLGTAAYSLVVAALIILCFVGNSWVLGLLFAVVYGVANGVMTVVRGTVPVFLLPGIPPGQVLGGLALLSALSRAAAPAVFAFVAGFGGNDTWPIALCVCVALVALGTYLWAKKET